MDTSQHRSSLDSLQNDAPRATPEHKESFFRELIRFSLIALLVVLPIRVFIAQPFIVSGASMETTFSTGEYLIVDQVTYRFEDPKRGDVIIFRYPKDPTKFFIKRVIGIPGDTVAISGDVVTLTNSEFPGGIIIDEPYIRDAYANAPLSVTLGSDEYFVMGDNRNASSDSRTWGALPRDNIIGRAFLRLFPLEHLDVLPGEYDTNAQILGSESTT